MKARKGQSALKINQKLDFIESVHISDDQKIWFSLMARNPEEIIPFKKVLGFPKSFCFADGEIRLDCKLNRGTEIEVIGGKFFKL